MDFETIIGIIICIIGIALFVISLKSLVISRTIATLASIGYLICIISKAQYELLFYILTVLYSFSFMVFETYDDYREVDLLSEEIPSDMNIEGTKYSGGRLFVTGHVKTSGIFVLVIIGIVLGLFAFSDEFMWIRYAISIAGIVANGIAFAICIWLIRRGAY